MNSTTICGHCKRIEHCRMFLKDPHAVVSECGRYLETELHKSVREILTDIQRRGDNDQSTMRQMQERN